MATTQQDRIAYDKPITKIRKALLESGIAQQINERSGILSDNSQIVLKRRYLSKDREGNILEDAEGMFQRVAKNLSQAELNYGATEGERQATQEAFADVMRSLEFLPNSPTLMNAGRELQQLSACFVLPIEDTLEGIFSRVKDTALIHKSGGGTGFSFSRLRPEGDPVGSTGGIASGPVSFIGAFDAATEVVKQGGTRRGANMGILDVTHPDILKFISAKSNGSSLTNFNISVAITEAFMECVKHRSSYNLINPRTGEVTGQLNARDVFDIITMSAWETGDPGIVFIDRINRDNPNPQLGYIESTNPCGEQPLLPYESCNLGSINLARMVHYGDNSTTVDFRRLSDTVHTAVRFLDNVIDMNRYPIPEIEAMSKSTRRIGVGVMGFSDMLVQLGIQYDSKDALFMGSQVMQYIQGEAHRASSALAEQRGSFPAWDGSIYKEPMRNSAPVTIAPTGTISIISGVSSGIEPLFALSYVRNVMDKTSLIENNPYFKAVADYEGFWSHTLAEELILQGTLKGRDVPDWVKDVFRVSYDISPKWHVHMQATFQQFTDNSVSKTINFPSQATVSDVADAYLFAYETGCKGLTVYRDGSKNEQVLSTGSIYQFPACPECSGLLHFQEGCSTCVSCGWSKCDTTHSPKV